MCLCCAIGLLGRPVSECGRLRHGDGGHARGDRRRRVLMLPSLRRSREDHGTCRRRYEA
jgi:hypothetical protein